MKSMILVTAVIGVAVSGCAGMFGTPNNGNPNDTPYAGSPGSVYSSAENPPRTMGMVSYDPNAVQPATGADVTPTPPGSPMPATPPTPKVPAPLR
jgi:hypothetical protein